MEREILFRGKRVDNGEWVEGIYSPVGWDFFDQREDKPCIMAITDDSSTDGYWFEIIRETRGQYTGLTDRNGKKIFEGDIIIEINATGKDKIPRKVVWVDLTFKCPYIKHHWAYGDNCVPLDFLHKLKNGNIEVIGNIHDNPELLKGEENE